MLEIKFGNMDNGKRRMLNSDNATKALSAVSGSSLVATNVPNVTKATLIINSTFHKIIIKITSNNFMHTWIYISAMR